MLRQQGCWLAAIHQSAHRSPRPTVQAAANAKNNLGMRKAKLYVSECMADGGPVLKRIRPRAKGRCGGAALLVLDASPAPGTPHDLGTAMRLMQLITARL